MKPIDLVLFAENSRKLPGHFLAPESENKSVPTWKVLAAHLVDFFTVCILTSSISSLFNLSIKNILVTRSLRIAFSHVNVMSFVGPLLPLMLFSYFFFSYFMNHGQTYGMLLLKRRIEMKSKSFKESFKWATHSLLLCISWGITFLFEKSKWQKLKGHDYLYQELLTHKETHEIYLLSRVDKLAKVIESEDWSKAA
jgi:hypothetical protein